MAANFGNLAQTEAVVDADEEDQDATSTWYGPLCIRVNTSIINFSYNYFAQGRERESLQTTSEPTEISWRGRTTGRRPPLVGFQSRSVYS